MLRPSPQAEDSGHVRQSLPGRLVKFVNDIHISTCIGREQVARLYFVRISFQQRVNVKKRKLDAVLSSGLQDCCRALQPAPCSNVSALQTGSAELCSSMEGPRSSLDRLLCRPTSRRSPGPRQMFSNRTAPRSEGSQVLQSKTSSVGQHSQQSIQTLLQSVFADLGPTLQSWVLQNRLASLLLLKFS